MSGQGTAFRGVNSRRVLELVRDSDCSEYDCEFVALAISHGVKLVTMDSKLLATFPGTAIGLVAARTPRRGPGR